MALVWEGSYNWCNKTVAVCLYPYQTRKEG